MRIEDLPRIVTTRLVKSVDLNHHGTLFAGRMAEWLVEVGFLTARQALACDPRNIVCVRLHGMDFTRSAENGATVLMEGRVAHLGRSSIAVYVQCFTLAPLTNERTLVTEGFVTFTKIVEGKTVP
ncbi:MAG: acyl-CoA thioesterase, partial [Candidatus Bipolaricaulota bacterium]|nr:acyl-CoA thioesterase [Candidatus Bipolaricaulota bacterium]